MRCEREVMRMNVSVCTHDNGQWCRVRIRRRSILFCTQQGQRLGGALGGVDTREVESVVGVSVRSLKWGAGVGKKLLLGVGEDSWVYTRQTKLIVE